MEVLFAFGVPDDGPAPLDHASTTDAKGKPLYRLVGNAPLMGALNRAMRARGWRASSIVMGLDREQDHPPPDVVVTCICDPDVQGRSLALLAEMIAERGTPVLNHPKAVTGTGRAAAAHAARDEEGVHVPRTSRFNSGAEDLVAHMADHGHTLPVIARPVGAHGARDLHRFDTVDGIAAFAAEQPGNIFITDFVDYASGDGFYRKYRCIYAGGRLVRRHLAVFDGWLVTGARECRDFMRSRPGLLAEEKAFLGDTAGALERRLVSLFDAFGLDFGVVDFALAEDGGVTVFEINPCFQITGSSRHGLQGGIGYVEDSNATITDALLDAIQARAGGGDS